VTIYTPRAINIKKAYQNFWIRASLIYQPGKFPFDFIGDSFFDGTKPNQGPKISNLSISRNLDMPFQKYSRSGF